MKKLMLTSDGLSSRKLIKEEYEILYYLVRGRNTIERLESLFDKATILKVIDKLEKIGLIIIHYRDDEVNSFMESPMGEAILQSKEYEDWFIECGD